MWKRTTAWKTKECLETVVGCRWGTERSRSARWRKMEREIEEFLCFSTKRAFHRDKSIRLRTKRDAAHKVLRHQAASCRVSLVRVARTDRPEMRKDLPRVIFHFWRFSNVPRDYLRKYFIYYITDCCHSKSHKTLSLIVDNILFSFFSSTRAYFFLFSSLSLSFFNRLTNKATK